LGILINNYRVVKVSKTEFLFFDTTDHYYLFGARPSKIIYHNDDTYSIKLSTKNYFGLGKDNKLKILNGLVHLDKNDELSLKLKVNLYPKS
jgi:hypothetical protein